MTRYRAFISLVQLTPVEVEANSEWQAKNAIQHNQFTWVGDKTYQDPEILNLSPIFDDIDFDD